MSIADDGIIDWLLAADTDPAIRWQVMRDLNHATPDAVATERARMTSEGWASDLLGAQGADGRWGDDGPDWVIWQGSWRDTMYTAWLLADLGVDPAEPRVRTVVERLRDGVRWDEEGLGDTPYFAGEIEPCTNGMVLKTGAAFREVDLDLVELLLSEQLDDGGWNCDAPVSTRSSFHGTICVMEGLLAAQRAGAAADIPEALSRAQDYLLDRGMFRSLRTGEQINPEWSLFAYPYSWHYDVLRGLDHLRVAGVAPDERAADAIALVESSRSDDGTWPRDAVSSERVRYGMEEVGAPSRWNTLRALRVLDWYHA